MRTETLIIQYLSTALFVLLALRAVTGWMRNRDQRAAHLALATGLFAMNSLISAINQTVFDTAKGEVVPRWISIVSSTVIYLSIYFFFRFLTDFVSFPSWLNWVFVLATVVNIVLAIIEVPDLRFDPQQGLVNIPGVDNPIPYRTYLGYVLGYLALAFGVLFVMFLIYGVRVDGLARFRMLMISSGFFLLFVVIGLLPRLLFGNPSSETINDLLRVLRYVALGSAPLLLLGFAPPKWVMRRYGVEPPRPRLGSS